MALKLFEYMASGVPIVASDVPLNKEVLRDGDNAVLFKADDPKGMAEAIREVLKNQKLAQKIGINAQKESQNYSYLTRAQKIIYFLKKEDEK